MLPRLQKTLGSICRWRKDDTNSSNLHAGPVSGGRNYLRMYDFCSCAAFRRDGHHCSPREKVWPSGSELVNQFCDCGVDNLIRARGTPIKPPATANRPSKLNATRPKRRHVRCLCVRCRPPTSGTAQAGRLTRGYPTRRNQFQSAQSRRWLWDASNKKPPGGRFHQWLKFISGTLAVRAPSSG